MAAPFASNRSLQSVNVHELIGAQENLTVALPTELLDGFEGKLTTEKWGKLAKISHDTALRDIQDLIAKGILKQEEGAGRSTAYALIREQGR